MIDNLFFCVHSLGPPEMLKDCRILNETWYSLNVKCKPGKSHISN